MHLSVMVSILHDFPYIVTASKETLYTVNISGTVFAMLESGAETVNWASHDRKAGISRVSVDVEDGDGGDGGTDATHERCG